MYIPREYSPLTNTTISTSCQKERHSVDRPNFYAHILVNPMGAAPYGSLETPPAQRGFANMKMAEMEWRFGRVFKPS
jgi:hypothetical protein